MIAAAVVGCLLALLQAPVAPAPPAAQGEDEDLRAAVQAYYEAQAQRDPDKAASFWSATANPRMTRDAFVAVFGEPAEDLFTVQIRSTAITGSEARVRVEALRTRLIMRDGRPVTSRTPFLNAQIWRKEGGGWKLLRDGPFAEDLADQYLALPEADRQTFLERQAANDLIGLHYIVSQRATMAVTVGRDYVRARGLFERALEVARASGQRRGEANALHNIAQAAYFLRDFTTATDNYEKELTVGREIGDDDIAASALFGLATVTYSRADYTPALAQFRDALAIYDKRDDTSAAARTLVSIGNIQYLQAEYDAASASYRRGLALAIATPDPSGATFARQGLGRVLAAQGDLPAAIQMYGHVLADARAALQADPRLKSNVSSALESLGELYYRLGNTDRARASYEEAKGLASDDPDSVARILSALGITELVAGRVDAAFAAYSESRVRFEQAKNPEGTARAWVGVGFSQTARGKFPEAIEAYRTAIALFEKKTNQDGIARAWLGLSRAQSGAGDEAAALESAARVATIADHIKSDDLAWRAAERSGEALRKLERLDDAKQAFERAAVAVDRLAADAPTNPAARADLADSASVWAGLALTLARQGDAAGALRALEARRAHIRRVHFAAFQHDIAPGATVDELNDEQAIVREIVSTRAQLRAETQSTRRDPARVDRLSQQLGALAAKRAEQQARLYERLPQLPLWRGLPQPALESSALLDLVAGGKSLLVTYLVTDDELLIVSAASGEDAPDVIASIAPIDRRGFADALAAAMQPAALRSRDDWNTRAAPLSAALIAPIAARLSGRDRVIVVPDDVLWKVPFEALPFAGGDLASRARVSYATSLATLMLERRISPTPEHPAAAFVAAPVISDSITAQLSLTLPSWKPQEPSVALAAAQAAATPYGEGAAVRSGAEATETAVRALVTTTDVLHVQAPLQISGAAPLLSSILLAATADSPAEDGRLEVRDLFAMTGRARTIVLPDGSTFGAAGAGSALDPIAFACAAAGVSSLVVGRWPSDGFAPDALAAAFHAKLAAGASTTDAWFAAVAAAREKGTAPEAWAGLRLIGGGS